MSVNQTQVTDLNTQSSTAVGGGPGPLNAVQKDQRGTPPIRLDPVQTYRLRLMFLTSTYLRMANEEMKNMLFTHPFDVYLGTSQENVLKKSFKESVIHEYWLPALRNIHDWLIQFGIAPYIVRAVVFPSITPQFDIGAFRKSSLASANDDKKAKKEEKEEKEGMNVEKDDDEKDDSNATKSKTPSIMEPSKKEKKKGNDNDNEKKESPPMAYTSRGNELHYVIEVPDYDSGYISTYVDRNSKQQFLWTWYPSAVPQTYDNRDGYTDTNIKFIVKDAPTIKGEYTCQLRTAIKEWLYLNSRKKMDSLSMRDRLNPVIFVEKQEPHAMKTPSMIDELSVGYSAAMNSGNSNLLQGGGGSRRAGAAGLDPTTGEMIMGYGQTLKYDTTRIDGMTDVGLNVYSDGYGSARRNEGPDYATLVSTLEFNRRGPNGSGIKNTPFGFGGINDDELTTDLGGLMTTFGSDPILTNPMSGIGYRVKKMEEGEKIMEIKNNELNAYVNSTTIEQQERSLEERLCFLAGFPTTFITGKSGSAKGGGGGGGGGKSGGGGSSGSKGTPSSSSGSGGFTTSSDSENSKGFLIGRVRHFKFYYQHQITKLFLKCYSESFVKSKVKLLNQLDENYWFILEQVYALRVELPVDPPPMDTASLMNNFGSGIVTVEEVIRNARLNLGLSLDVMDDPEFMDQAKKRLENKYDTESQLKLQQKYATKGAEGGGGGGGKGKPAKKSASGGEKGGKKRKATTEIKKKDQAKKPKKQ